MKRHVNKIIKLLIVSDFALYFSLGLFSPLFALFIADRIDGSAIEIVGIATAMYWIARVLTVVPISSFMDHNKGEKDEFAMMITGSLLLSLLPLFYLGVNSAWHIYIIQFIMGISGSMATPAWRILFTNHLDRGATGYEWGLEDIGLGISIAGSAYLGAFIADNFGFNTLLYLVAFVGCAGTAILFPLHRYTDRVKSIRTLTPLKRLKLSRRRHVRVGVRSV